MPERLLKVLIVDDCQSDAETLSYLLTKKLGCRVEIAGNGLEGLNKLSDSTFDLIFLDLMMPFIDGLEVLTEIRAWRKTADLPVVIISANTDSKTVRSLIELKIFDYVIKPYNADRLVKRLAGKLSEYKSRLAMPVNVQIAGDDVVRIPGREVLLVVDGDANFRQFFVSTLGERYHILEATNGPQAIAASIKHGPDCLFVGSQIGLFARDRMVAKLRAIPSLAGLKIYRLDADGQNHNVDLSVYDGFVKRTFVPEAFLDSFERCLGGDIAKEPAENGFTSLEQYLVSATEQAFGMMMSTEISVDPNPLEPDSGNPLTCASIYLVGYKEGMQITIEFSCDQACAVAMAMLMLQMEEQETLSNLELAHNSLAEALNIIGGQIRNSLNDEGREFTLGLPFVEERSGLDVSAEVRKSFRTHFSFGEGRCFSMSVRTEALSTNSIEASKIVEGMVIARPIDIGVTQVSKGSRLDADTINEIKTHGIGNVEIFEPLRS